MTPFPQIVGLICNYINLRKNSSNDFKEFIEWAKEHHEDLAKHIEENNLISREVKNLLDQDREILLNKIQSIDNLLASISSRLEVVGDLTKAIKPGIEISEQAVSILKQLVESSGSYFIKLSDSGGERLKIIGSYKDIKLNEERFLADDLSVLVAAGLLIMDYNSQGNEKYSITREAEIFFKSIGD